MDNFDRIAHLLIIIVVVFFAYALLTKILHKREESFYGGGFNPVVSLLLKKGDKLFEFINSLNDAQKTMLKEILSPVGDTIFEKYNEYIKKAMNAKNIVNGISN